MSQWRPPETVIDGHDSVGRGCVRSEPALDARDRRGRTDGERFARRDVERPTVDRLDVDHPEANRRHRTVERTVSER